MSYLAKNWLTNGLIDFEYKKYIMLSYLKLVEQHFSDKMLYPIFSDLKNQYSQLEFLKIKKENLANSFPKRLLKFDFDLKQVHYASKIQNEKWFSELEEIVEYALMIFKEKVGIGCELEEWIESTITIEPVGVLPLYKNEGYFFITINSSKVVRIYKFFFSPINAIDQDDEIRSILVDEKQYSLTNTFERIKSDILKTDRNLPIPATYLIQSSEKFPFAETFLPIAKKLLRDNLAA